MTYQQLLDRLLLLPKDSEYLTHPVTAYLGDGEYHCFETFGISEEQDDWNGNVYFDRLLLIKDL